MEVVLDAPRGIRLRCRVPRSRRERARGLIGSAELADGHALFIPNATSVHTVGMRSSILVARLDASLRVVDVRQMRPWRLLMPKLGARHVLEYPVDVDLREGDVVRLSEPARRPWKLSRRAPGRA